VVQLRFDIDTPGYTALSQNAKEVVDNYSACKTANGCATTTPGTSPPPSPSTSPPGSSKSVPPTSPQTSNQSSDSGADTSSTTGTPSAATEKIKVCTEILVPLLYP
jgi:hypothetical protein